jgi:hypothetical protein
MGEPITCCATGGAVDAAGDALDDEDGEGDGCCP